MFVDNDKQTAKKEKTEEEQKKKMVSQRLALLSSLMTQLNSLPPAWQRRSVWLDELEAQQ